MRRTQSAHALHALAFEDKDRALVESTDAGTSQASESQSHASEGPEEVFGTAPTQQSQSSQQQKRDLRSRRSLQHSYKKDLSLRPVLEDLQEFFKSVAPRPDAEFVAFQAILSDLPRFGYYAARLAQQQADKQQLNFEGVEEALRASYQNYPQYAEQLGRLVVVHACDDLVIFADHERCRLFTSVRGTDLKSIRDLGDDLLVFLGLPPMRVDNLRTAYTAIRTAHGSYESFGCGHSLGGAALHELVCSLETDEALALTRVDIFNPVGSPLKPQYSLQGRTRFLSHLVSGDLISHFYCPPGREDDPETSEMVVHERDPRFIPHRLGHFLPK